MSDAALPADARRVRRAVAPRWVLLGLGVSFLVAFLAAALLYQRYVAFERVAARHVVAEPELLVYIDLEKVVLYEPFRTHLMPLVLEGPVDPRLKPRLTRLKQHTRIELGVDIRELVFSRNLGSQSWALAVGGMFPNAGVLLGIQRVLEEEGRPQQLDPTTEVLSFAGGTYAAQAEDAVVVFASDQASLNTALRTRPGAAVTPRPLHIQLKPGAEAPSVERLNAELSLDTPHFVTVTAKLVKPAPAELTTVRAWISGLAQTWGRVEPKTLSVEVSGPNELRARFPVTSANLDHAAQQFAQTLRVSAFSAP